MGNRRNTFKSEPKFTTSLQKSRKNISNFLLILLPLTKMCLIFCVAEQIFHFYSHTLRKRIIIAIVTETVRVSEKDAAKHDVMRS